MERWGRDFYRGAVGLKGANGERCPSRDGRVGLALRWAYRSAVDATLVRSAAIHGESSGFGTVS